MTKKEQELAEKEGERRGVWSEELITPPARTIYIVSEEIWIFK
jgi:hypothetical protein